MKVISLYFFLFAFGANIFLANVNTVYATEHSKEHLAKIKLGMSNALTGPTAQLGLQIKKGAEVYFNQLNKQGGISGRKVEIISLDDGYEPVNTVSNTRKLIDEDKVFALFGYVGTPTSHAILPLIQQKNIPYLMPFTGADFLRQPIVKNIINLRASYNQEVEAQINFLVQYKNFKNIGLLIQADEFGLSVERAYNKALKNHGLTPVLTARYKRNSENIGAALRKLKHTPMQALVFAGTYSPMSRLINKGVEQNFTPFFSTISFVSSKELFKRLKYPSKVLVTEVMPEPSQCSLTICKNFIKDMLAAGVEKSTSVQFEGYINAYVFAYAAKQCGKDLTRDCLLNKLENTQLKLTSTNNTNKIEQLNIHFSANNHQGLDKIYFSFYQNRK